MLLRFHRVFANRNQLLGLVCSLALTTLSVNNAAAGTLWSQGFETDKNGWFDEGNGWDGTATRVASGGGTLGVTSSSGGFHAEFTQSGGPPPTGPFSGFDGYRSVWPGDYMASIDIYLDTGWALGEGFDYSVAANGSDGLHQRDFIFHVTKDTSTGDLLVGSSNNTNFAPREDLETLTNYVVADTGWYTFQHHFYDVGGILNVDLNLLDGLGSTVYSNTLSSAADTIPGEVGGNRYAWFTNIDVATGIAVDNQSLSTVPEPASMLTFAALGLCASVGARRKMRRSQGRMQA
ncbi:PEP-CTERM sorting domain-containing protein [Roseimaritima ulvae]|uniref:PEP-CTERM protein-sorting domain-containing protein n=1 Tax=Roseimaritima ulvae TaxID=980254 RepID=A0A5B9R2L3_9BACT|nr:PEP-CTERM sorting domain-containing protein [Roseimaritima ulvae]QEG40533.1 hypothetical protein UC8_25470 [Roseimaritima ulvae]